MQSLVQAAQTVDDLLQCVVREGGFDLTCSVHIPNAIHALRVTFSGPDMGLLIEHDGDVLHALKLLTAQAAGFEFEDRGRIEFELEGLEVTRQLDACPSMLELEEDADLASNSGLDASQSLWRELVLYSVKEDR